MQVVFAWLLLAWFSMGMSITHGALSELTPLVNKFWPSMIYILYPLSGAMFLVDTLPHGMRQVVLYIPIVHANEMLRDGFFGSHFHAPRRKSKNLAISLLRPGDDIYFSPNDFDILTVPGIVSHQEDFFAQQSPMRVYLDMRYHLVLHLTFDHLKLDKNGINRMMRSYFNRFNDAYHYESAEALIMGMEDILAGEPFWEDNLDLAGRRAELAALTVNEKLFTALAFSREPPQAPQGPLVRSAA